TATTGTSTMRFRRARPRRSSCSSIAGRPGSGMRSARPAAIPWPMHGCIPPTSKAPAGKAAPAPRGEPAGLDQLETGFVDPLEHPVERSLVDDLAAQHRLDRLDLGVEAVERREQRLPQPALDP